MGIGIDTIAEDASLQLDAASSQELRPLQSPLDDQAYRPRFSGHETFPLRYGWLKKAFDAARQEQADGRPIFAADDAIARFGVGKNMVSSIRHWGMSAGVVVEDDDRRLLDLTDLGRLLFDEVSGLDPWMEHPSTSWVTHWNISGQRRLTTWFWTFSHYPGIEFERESLVQGVMELAERHAWSRASMATIKRDVACLVRTYAPLHTAGAPLLEDSLESPLSELGLIRATGQRDGFRFIRGPKTSLSAGVFSYAVNDYWSWMSPTSNTLSFEALAYGPGSPGRVFQLGENDLIEMLTQTERITNGTYQWSEAAGLRQLIRFREISAQEALQLLELDYRKYAS